MNVQYTYPSSWIWNLFASFKFRRRSSDLVHAYSTNYCQVKPAGIGWKIQARKKAPVVFFNYWGFRLSNIIQFSMPSFISITIVSEQSSESVRLQGLIVHYSHWFVHIFQGNVHLLFFPNSSSIFIWKSKDFPSALHPHTSGTFLDHGQYHSPFPIQQAYIPPPLPVPVLLSHLPRDIL